MKLSRAAALLAAASCVLAVAAPRRSPTIPAGTTTRTTSRS